MLLRPNISVIPYNYLATVVFFSVSESCFSVALSDIQASNHIHWRTFRSECSGILCKAASWNSCFDLDILSCFPIQVLFRIDSVLFPLYKCSFFSPFYQRYAEVTFVAHCGHPSRLAWPIITKQVFHVIWNINCFRVT